VLRLVRQRLGACILATIVVAGCASSTWYYYESNLNTLSVGTPKADVLTLFEGGERDGHPREGMQIRAARKTERGTLLEVGEVPLMNGASQRITAYWFLFEDGRLVQWGRPQDWRAVSGRYDIHFNPSPSVPR
jgi:hypothetical protein